MSVTTAIAWAVGTSAVLGLVVWRARREKVHGPATCARCGGDPEHETLRCGTCGGDLREVGLEPANASRVPFVVRRCMVWTALIPVMAIFVTVVVAILRLQPGRQPQFMFLASPVEAWVETPASGAYGTCRLSMQDERRSSFATPQEPPAFLIVGLEDTAGDRLGTMMALRSDGEWYVETTDGPTLGVTSLAAWMLAVCPDLTELDADAEAADIMDVIWMLERDPRSLRVGAAIVLERFGNLGTDQSQSVGGGSYRSPRNARGVTAVWLAGLVIIASLPPRRRGKRSK